MSKRTNAFQKAILFIHDQLKDTNAKVIESAELKENNINVKREIDVLIEKEEEGKIYRIAIECRDRAYKDDITWIDGLIGKFIHLEVNKVIAVSSSGLSKAAEDKAKANNIEFRSLKEIKSTDWKSEFIKLGFCDFEIKFDIKEIIAETGNNFKFSVKPDYEVLCGNEKGTFAEFFESFKKNFWTDLFHKKFNKSFLRLYKAKEDLSKIAKAEHRVPVSDIKIVHKNVLYDIVALNFYLIGTPKVKDVETRHFQYSNSMLGKAEFDLRDIEKQFTIYTAQAKPDGKLNISIDKKKFKKKVQKK